MSGMEPALAMAALEGMGALGTGAMAGGTAATAAGAGLGSLFGGGGGMSSLTNMLGLSAPNAALGSAESSLFGGAGSSPVGPLGSMLGKFGQTMGSPGMRASMEGLDMLTQQPPPVEHQPMKPQAPMDVPTTQQLFANRGLLGRSNSTLPLPMGLDPMSLRLLQGMGLYQPPMV